MNALAPAFGPGQRVGIAMPMTVESVIAYLAVIKAGGVVVSIADTFSPAQIEARLRIAEPSIVITQDVVRRAGRLHAMAEKVWDAGAPRAVVVSSGRSPAVALRPGDTLWDDVVDWTAPYTPFPAHPASPEHHSNILFSSGTTADPKAIPWTHLTPIKAAMDGHFHQDLGPDDVTCWPTNLGWMMGPWLIYASLVNGSTMALYDDAPTDRRFGEFVRDAGLTMLGVVPSLVSTWRSSGCMSGLDWSRIRLMSTTGEASHVEDSRFLMRLAGGKPLIEYCGGTELGGAYVTSTVVEPVVAAAFSTPALGIDFALHDETGNPADTGEAFLVPPSIGLSSELLNGDHDRIYYGDTPGPGLRRHGDRVERAPDGYYRVLGRADDNMNLGGIKVGSAELERVLTRTRGVVELAAVSVSPPGGGPERLVVFAACEPNADPDPEELRTRMQKELKSEMNPLFKVSKVILLDALPRTASGKVMRRKLRDHLQRGA